MITREDRERMLKDIRVRLPHYEVKDREPLLKDLCGRLPYGVIGLIHNVNGGDYNTYIVGGDIDLFSHNFINIKPYLRPMSSMTEEEKEEYESTFDSVYDVNDYGEDADSWHEEFSIHSLDWLNAHHFDYRGLIPKGLALEAPEGMYN